LSRWLPRSTGASSPAIARMAATMRQRGVLQPLLVRRAETDGT
jgi:ParB-like chromosome segregation protein Spo0J